MKLLDEEEVARKKVREQKFKKIIVIAIITLVNLSIAIIAIIVYRNYNPDKITTYIDGKKYEKFDSLLDFEKDENGNTQIYIPIRDVAEYFGYKSYNGDYKKASEEDDKCYIEKEKREVAMYELNSKTIYKLDLENKNNDYNYCYTNKTVFRSNGKLYTSVDGIEQGYNISFSYDERKKTINIYTMDYLITTYASLLEDKAIGNYGTVEIDENFQNWKAVFDGMLVVKSEENKYGVINTSDYSFVLEPKYDNIEYIQYSSDFLVESYGKKGIISKEGKTKVTTAYDELTLMDRDTNLYRTKKDNLYGVIDANEKVIIHPEFNAIGIDVTDFFYNGIKSGYIILNKLIPVQKGDKWGFYNINGKQITEFKYDNIGYKIGNSNNVYSLLEVTNYDVIVVGQKDKYTFMDSSGDDTMLPLVFDKIYMEISSGQISYVMTINDKKYDVLKNLVKQGINEKTNEKE